jgi:hypothetical protein
LFAVKLENLTGRGMGAFAVVNDAFVVSVFTATALVAGGIMIAILKFVNAGKVVARLNVK